MDLALNNLQRLISHKTHQTKPSLLINCLHSLIFQVLLCITNNSIKRQSFVYTLFNEQTVLFQTNQFIMSTNLNGSKYCFESIKKLIKCLSFVYI